MGKPNKMLSLSHQQAPRARWQADLMLKLCSHAVWIVRLRSMSKRDTYLRGIRHSALLQTPVGYRSIFGVDHFRCQIRHFSFEESGLPKERQKQKGFPGAKPSGDQAQLACGEIDVQVGQLKAWFRLCTPAACRAARGEWRDVPRDRAVYVYPIESGNRRVSRGGILEIDEVGRFEEHSDSLGCQRFLEYASSRTRQLRQRWSKFWESVFFSSPQLHARCAPSNTAMAVCVQPTT